MTTDTGVEAFLRRYFAATGYGLREDQPGILSSPIPASLRPEFRHSDALRITFDPAVLVNAPDVEIAAPGSYLLDRVIDDATKMGWFCVAWIGAVADPPADVVERSFRPKNASVEVGASQITQVPHVLFNFVVRLTSDERFERLESIVIDSRTGREREVDPSEVTGELPAQAHIRLDSNEVAAQYRAACRVLEARLEPIVASLRDRASRFLKEEVERIKAYYDRSVRELLESRAAGSGDELRALEFERERRLAEAEEKFRLAMEVELCNVRLLAVDVTEAPAVVSHRGARRVVPIAYDRLRPVPVFPSCEVCGAVVPEPSLCFAGHIAGLDCVKVCDFCDAAYCRTCCLTGLAIVPCGTCGRAACPDHFELDALSQKAHCPDHILACAICTRHVGPEYTRTCRTCEQAYCAICVAPPSGRCTTCRTLPPVRGDDPRIARLLRTEIGLARATKWRCGSNHRYTVIAAKALVWNQLFVLDANGETLLRKKLLGV